MLYAESNYRRPREQVKQQWIRPMGIGKLKAQTNQPKGDMFGKGKGKWGAALEGNRVRHAVETSRSLRALTTDAGQLDINKPTGGQCLEATAVERRMQVPNLRRPSPQTAARAT